MSEALDSLLTISIAGLALPHPREPNLADARVPESIPNIRECDYLVEDAFGAEAYRSEVDDHVIGDDEMHAIILSTKSRALGRPAFVPLPLTHMAYEQGLREQAARISEAGLGATTIDRARCRITYDKGCAAYRLAWLHSPGPDGAHFGSNNWTPERGKLRVESLTLNED